MGDSENRQEALRVTLSLDKLQRYREKFPAWKDADQFQITADND